MLALWGIIFLYREINWFQCKSSKLVTLYFLVACGLFVLRCTFLSYARESCISEELWYPGSSINDYIDISICVWDQLSMLCHSFPFWTLCYALPTPVRLNNKTTDSINECIDLVGNFGS